MIRLSISKTVAFDIRFTLNDAGVTREFGFRAEADRCSPAQGDETIGVYLDQRAKVRMTAWLTEAPLRHESESEGEGSVASQVMPGGDALAALYELVPNMAGIVYSEYLQATSAKAKLGN